MRVMNTGCESPMKIYISCRNVDLSYRSCQYKRIHYEGENNSINIVGKFQTKPRVSQIPINVSLILAWSGRDLIPHKHTKKEHTNN